MKKQLLCGVAAGALTLAAGGTTLAADMPVKAAPAPVAGCIWAGTYIGTHMGYGHVKARGTYFGDSETTDFRRPQKGILNGVQVGQNWCSNTFVWGWEGDVSFGALRATRYNHNSSEADYLDSKTSLLSSLRLRLGMPIDPKTMIYLTGGPALVHGSVTQFDEDGPAKLKSGFTKFGGVVGVGAHWAQTANVFWKIEGLYYIFNANKILIANPTDPSPDIATARIRDAFVVRVGLDYKLGGDPWGKSPVAAAYPTKAGPAPAFNWSGFYVGGAAGAQVSHIEISSPSGSEVFQPVHDSLALGGLAGLQGQFGEIVLGVEGGYVTGFGHESFHTPSINPFTPSNDGLGEGKFKDSWSFGGRAGWSMGRWMPYVTVGWADGKFSFHDNDGTSDLLASVKTHGLYYGTGFDLALWNNWILGFEYRFYDFRAKSTIASDGTEVRFRPKTETVMARLSYKFDWGKSPVVAKY